MYLSWVRPHFVYCMWFWTSQYKKDVKIHEFIQKRATELVKGLEDLKEEAENTWIVQSGENETRGDLIVP